MYLPQYMLWNNTPLHTPILLCKSGVKEAYITRICFRDATSTLQKYLRFHIVFYIVFYGTVDFDCIFALITLVVHKIMHFEYLL